MYLQAQKKVLARMPWHAELPEGPVSEMLMQLTATCLSAELLAGSLQLTQQHLARPAGC